VLDPKSGILAALYQMKREEAIALADAAPVLTVWEAAALNRTEALERLLDSQPDLTNAYSPDGNTPLGLACFFGAPAAVRALLQHGASVNVASRNEMQVQPLHAAVAGRNAEAVALLLEQGANVNARQQVGYTPLMGAASAGRDDIADLLLGRGADPSLTSDDGKTAATIAADHGHHTLAERLQGTRA
jgi:ankyrin repeat protein